VNTGAPKTAIKVQMVKGNVKVDLNLTHTVRDLFNHLRTYQNYICDLICGKIAYRDSARLSNLTAGASIRLMTAGIPKKTIEESDKTISEEQLAGVMIIMS